MYKEKLTKGQKQLNGADYRQQRTNQQDKIESKTCP